MNKPVDWRPKFRQRQCLLVPAYTMHQWYLSYDGKQVGPMMFKASEIQLETVFGDGSYQVQSGGLFDKLVGAGKRLITGEGIFTTVFTHTGPSGKAHVGFAAPYPGTIIPLALTNFNGRIICQKDSFLCAAKGVQIGVHFQKKILTGLFGGEGFVMQQLDGDGF